MPRVIERKPQGEGRRFAVVVSRFHAFLTGRLLEGALTAFREHGVREDDVTVVHVPGSFEIPLVAKRLGESGRFHGVVCLGTVVRGQTPHFDHICTEAARGIGQASRETGCPMTFGVLTVETVEQALERAGERTANKGYEAAEAALEMAAVIAALKDEARGEEA